VSPGENGLPLPPPKRGVPDVAPWIEPLTDFEQRLEHALTTGAAVVLEAPAGAGKTTALARWAGTHPRRGAVWIAPDARTRSWSDVLDRLAAAVGMDSWGGDLGALAEHVRALGPIVLVVDRADQFESPLDPDAVTADLGVLTSVGVVLTARTPLSGFTLLGPARVQALPRHLLTLGADGARRLLDAHALEVPAAVVAQIVAATEGMPAAVLDVANRWAEDRERLLPAERRSVSRLAALSALARAEALGGPAARTLLMLLGSLVETPPALLDDVVPLAGADPSTVARLVAEGHLTERPSEFTEGPVWVVATALRTEFAAIAVEQEPALTVAAHRAAADHADCRDLQPFHRARAGEPQEAAELVLRRWHGDEVPGGAVLWTVLRSLPEDVLAAEPVLAALRVALHAFERSTAGALELRDFEDHLLQIPADTVAALDLNDRILVDAAAAEVLTRRGFIAVALQRALPLVEQIGDDLSRLDRRGRRAYSYLLVVVAELHVTQMVPHRAMPLALRVLSLDGRERWTISKFRAAAVAAFCHLFAADRPQMLAALKQADLYFSMGGYAPGPVQAYQWLTEFADAARCSDPARVARVHDAFLALGDSDPLSRVLADVIGAVRAMLSRDAAEAEASLSRVVAAADFGAHPPAARALALWLAANAAVVGRRAGGALGLLAGAVPPPGHAVCFDAVRATAHLALGQPQAALDTTAGCLAMGPRHSIDALASVLVARAVAHLELRHPESARSDLMRGMRLIPPEWHRSVLGSLPGSVLHALAELLDDEEHADIQSRLLELAFQDEGTLSVAPTLSKKELKLLILLQEGLALTEIADRLFVSINTVKTQCRSLYRKLGVSSRHEAVDFAFVRGAEPGTGVLDGQD